jgi:4-hydroxy-4-methyl-2-oxoglutarate aldolase
MNDYTDILNNTSTASISDVLDQLGIESHCEAVLPISQSFRIYGRAHTVRLGAQSEPPEPYDDYMDDLLAGEVCVMEARGLSQSPVWGDLRSLVAQQRGVAGTVIDGVARDVAATLEIQYPVFSRSTTMRGGKGRIRIEQTQVPVTIDGVLVCPGDIVFGDADGVVIIPQSREQEILENVQQMDVSEEQIKAALKRGTSIKEARKQYGYRLRDQQKSLK